MVTMTKLNSTRETETAHSYQATPFPQTRSLFAASYTSFNIGAKLSIISGILVTQSISTRVKESQV